MTTNRSCIDFNYVPIPPTPLTTTHPPHPAPCLINNPSPPLPRPGLRPQACPLAHYTVQGPRVPRMAHITELLASRTRTDPPSLVYLSHPCPSLVLPLPRLPISGHPSATLTHPQSTSAILAHPQYYLCHPCPSLVYLCRHCPSLVYLCHPCPSLVFFLTIYFIEKINAFFFINNDI